MPEIDLREFGFPGKKVQVEAAVGGPYRVEGGVLAFLNEEAHDDYPAVRRSVRNDCVLFDSGVVDFTGVEGFIQGVEKFTLDALYGHISLDEFKARLGPGLSDAQVIEKMEAVWKRALFAPSFKILRPSAIVESLEDHELYKRGDNAKKDMKANFLTRFMEVSTQTIIDHQDELRSLAPAQRFIRQKELAAQIRERLEKEQEEYVERELNQPRNKPFVENLIRLRCERGCTRAAFVNLGRRHQQEVAKLLREHGGWSYIPLNPAT